jgi:hypothetical protein
MERIELSSAVYLICHESCPRNFYHSPNFVANGFPHTGENFVGNLADKSHLMAQFLAKSNVKCLEQNQVADHITTTKPSAFQEKCNCPISR